MANYKANVIGVGVINMTTGMTSHPKQQFETNHEWSIYENKGLYAYLTNSGFLLLATEGTFEIGDTVKLFSNEGRSLSKHPTIVGISICEKDALLKMLKENNYDYYPIRAFKARSKGNKKLSTSYSVKGYDNAD